MLVTAQGLTNHLAAKVETLALTAADRVAQTATLAFDIAVWQLLAPLTVGATVVVLDPDTARDPVALLAAVRTQGLTVWETTPGLLALVPAQPTDVGALRWLVVTGEAVPPAVIRRWRQVGGAVTLKDVRFAGRISPLDQSSGPRDKERLPCNDLVCGISSASNRDHRFTTHRLRDAP